MHDNDLRCDYCDARAAYLHRPEEEGHIRTPEILMTCSGRGCDPGPAFEWWCLEEITDEASEWLWLCARLPKGSVPEGLEEYLAACASGAAT